MLRQFYSILPISLQHACATAQGAKYYLWRYGGIFQGYLNNLKRSEYLPAEQMIELQKAELKRILQFASAHVPHYRKYGTAEFTTLKIKYGSGPRISSPIPFRGGR